MKKILILNSFIKKYTGSEIVTLELAKTFKELGFLVSVAAFDIGAPLNEEFQKLSINVVNIYNLDHNEHYDIIWSHHFITLEYCLLDKKIKASKIIFSSLSPYTSLESPPFILDRISIFLANSLETKNKLVSMGIKENNIILFPNPVPSNFFHFRKKFNNRSKLRRIAIISNHIPQELLKVYEDANKYSLNIDIIGSGFNEVLVTPEVLLKYDAIITIGKTAQYCLSLGLPVYCYDIFGGSGWITSQNIIELGKYNFSGRDSSLKKDTSLIISEILNYRIHNIELDKMIKWAKTHYNMVDLVKNIINTTSSYTKNLENNTLYSIIKRQRDFYIENIFGDNFSQLFLKTNSIFSEANSIRKRIVHNSILELKFDINDENTFEFRFDPSNKPILISSLTINLEYSDNTQDHNISYITENLIYLDDKLLSLSKDPKIFFRKKQNKKLSCIIIRYVTHDDILYENSVNNYLNRYYELDKRNIDLKNNISEIENRITFFKQERLEYLAKNSKLETIISSLESQRIIDLNEYQQKIKKQTIMFLNKKEKIILKNKNLIETNRNLEEKIRHKEYEIKNLNSILTEITTSGAYKTIMKIRKFLNFFKKTDYKILKKSKFFNSQYYLESNKDVRDSNIDPIIHYLNYGWKEGRNPSDKFDTNYYLTENEDVKDANINPLIHYIKHGKKEGRTIRKTGNEHSTNRIINLFYLVRNNPTLISKFFFLAKNKGIRYAILKANSKVNKTHGDENNISILSFDKLFSSLDHSYLYKIEKFYVNKEKTKPIDIVIPVYNGFEFLYNLFESLKKNTSLPYRLLIADDNSPDERVVPFIENFISQNPDINIIFIKNKENQGFLKTVNLLAEYAENHLVLLNTDTELPEFWLERLMYPIFKDNQVASTTPFTNSGTICSFPNYLIDNKDIYGNLTLEQVDNIFKLVNADITMLEVPTGVGFCMGVNFNIVKKIGMFDEIYGKGYGEENDWCQRAIKAGYKNIHITNLFVYHKHGGSFLSEDKKRYIDEHYKILLSKFPTYDEQIQSTIKQNSLHGLRMLVRCIIDFKHSTQKNILIIDHELGGGANLYRKQKVDEALSSGNGVVLFSYNININKYFISFLTNEISQKFTLETQEILIALLDYIKIEAILLNGLVSFPNVYDLLSLTLDIKSKSNAKLIFPMHDYFCISPNYTLLTEHNMYNGVPIDVEKHNKFLMSSKAEFKIFCKETNAKLWQSKWKEFLLSCDEILCFSHSSEDICTTAYKDIKDKLIYIPHDISGTFDEIYNKDELGKNRVIGILGNINLPKGSLVVKELISHIENHNLDIKVVLIGNIDIEIKSNSFIKTGSYQKSDIPSLLKKYQISEFLIPSIWPETYSYTTDEIMQLGYPITVFDLGAPAERVKLYEKGRIISLNAQNYIGEISKSWI